MKTFGRRAFILPIALALGLLIAAVVLFCAGLVRRGQAAPQRAIALSRAEALYGLDAALAQLQATAGADTVATAPASIVGGAINPAWIGAWAQGLGTPVWLVSGYGVGSDPSPYVAEPTKLTDSLSAPLVTTTGGSYAYAVEDLSQKVFATKTDRLDLLSVAFGDSAQVLRQQTMIVPAIPTGITLASSEITTMSYGLLTNPIDGGFKLDLNTPNAASSSDAVTQSVAAWRDSTQFLQNRPLIWGEAAVFVGVFHDANNVPQLALNFWADAWNPTTQNIAFNTKGVADLRVRLVPPAGNQGVIYLDATQAGIVGFDLIDLSSVAIPVDIYGPMAPGEVRFISEYTLQALPNSNGAEPNAKYIKLNLPSGNWSMVFETLAGQPIQTIENINFASVNGRVVAYAAMTSNSKSAPGMSQTNAQAIYSLKIANRLGAQTAGTFPAAISPDPRSSMLNFPTGAYYSHDSDPVHAQTSYSLFSGAEAYPSGSSVQLFDLPNDNTDLITPGALYQMPIAGALAVANAAYVATPAFSLGGLAAGAANALFDKYFFSSIPASNAIWDTTQGLPLPNGNLRLTGTPTPTFAAVQAAPPQSLLLQGAFNINTADANEWSSMLSTMRSLLEFRPDASAQTSAVSDAQRQTWAQAIVSRLNTNAKPWASLAALAGENILPPDVFGQVSALLQPRGDTFIVHVYATATGGVAALDALVQRLPTIDGTGRRFQVLSISWVTPHAQS